MLKNKEVFYKIVLSVIPGVAVCATALSSVVFGAISFVTVVVSWLLVCLIKNFLTEKTLPFAAAVISLGITGVLTMVASLFFKSYLEDVAYYLPLLAVTTTLLISKENVFGTIKNTLVTSLWSGGVGAVFLIITGILKEFLGNGSLFGFDIYTKIFSPAEFFKSSAGGLLIAAGLTVVYNLIVKGSEKRGAE